MSDLPSPKRILTLLQAAYFPALFAMVGVAILFLSSYETTLSCDRASAECSIHWQYLLRAPSGDQWLMTENAGMVMESETDSQEDGAFRPVIRLQTGREIAVQSAFSSSAKWQERLVRDFNGFLDSPKSPSFHYKKDNHIVIGLGFILQCVAVLLVFVRRRNVY